MGPHQPAQGWEEAPVAGDPLAPPALAPRSGAARPCVAGVTPAAEHWGSGGTPGRDPPGTYLSVPAPRPARAPSHRGSQRRARESRLPAGFMALSFSRHLLPPHPSAWHGPGLGRGVPLAGCPRHPPPWQEQTCPPGLPGVPHPPVPPVQGSSAPQTPGEETSEPAPQSLAPPQQARGLWAAQGPPLPASHPG